MSYLTDMSVTELENEIAVIVTLLIAKGIFTMNEYDAVLAEVKRLDQESNAKRKKELDDLFKDKKGHNA